MDEGTRPIGQTGAPGAPGSQAGYPSYGTPPPPPRGPSPTSKAVLASVAAALIVSLLVGAAAGFGGAWVVLSGQQPTAAGPGGTIKVTGTTNEPVAAAAAAALPSVVNIDVSGNAPTSPSSGLPKNHPNVPLQGNGSGVAFREAPNGGTFIITNNHVVADASSIIVTPVKGERMKATLVGKDPDTDIAVLRVDSSMPVVQIGDSKKLAVGDLAVAIGSPFGLEHSVSSGVISALHRALPPSSTDSSSAQSLADVIQTDAAINPGNSGGALVGRDGKLIGIPSAIFSSSGSNDGIGFAIPANTAVSVADQLINTGKVQHPFLGIVGQTVTEPFAKRKGLPVTEGAYVIEAVKGSSAEKAGIKAGDLIVQMNDQHIRTMEELVAAVRDAGVGATVRLTLYRAKEKTSVQMTVGVKPSGL